MESTPYQQGRVDAVLDEHSQHLSRINGSIDRFADSVEKLTLQIQRLGDAADADRQTVKVTAEALKEADAARRDKDDQRWSPVQKTIAILGGFGAIAAVLAEVLTHVH